MKIAALIPFYQRLNLNSEIFDSVNLVTDFEVRFEFKTGSNFQVQRNDIQLGIEKSVLGTI